jgi:hypothetical protein
MSAHPKKFTFPPPKTGKVHSPPQHQSTVLVSLTPQLTLYIQRYIQQEKKGWSTMQETDFKICPVCKKTFTREDLRKEREQYGEPKQDTIDRDFKHRVYCSYKCSYKGTVKNPQQKKRNQDLIRLSKYKEKTYCELCGYDKVLDIHHILPRNKGGNDEDCNKIILCPNCHALFHRGFLTIDDLEIIKDRNHAPTTICSIDNDYHYTNELTNSTVHNQLYSIALYYTNYDGRYFF